MVVKRKIDAKLNQISEKKPSEGRIRTKSKSVRIREIQAAAKKLFFEKGFSHTTMDEIAQRAGISKGTVYLYFQNKEELYISLMMPVLLELGRLLEKLEKDIETSKIKSKKALIKSLYMAHKKIYEYDPEGIRIIQAFQQGNIFSIIPGETLDKLNHRATHNYNISRRGFEKAIKAGIIKARDPIILADIFWAIFIGIIQLEESKYRATNKNHIESTLRISFDVLSEGL